jgi:tetratricopeptide (TPR) repeat protein
VSTSLISALALLGLLLLIGAVRSHRDLVRWLGRDPAAGRRALRALALALAALAVARALHLSASEPPRLAGAGADVVLALDASHSMDALDTAPSRMRRALRTAERVVQSATSVRIGLVLFAGDAYIALPLTQDTDALLTYLRSVDTEMISRPGTDLARALDASARVFDPESSRPRRVILLSDGEHEGAGLEDALGRLRALGIEVTAVGFGTADGAYVPGPGNEPLRDDRGRAVESRRADHVLRRVALSTGGTYHREFEDSPQAERLLPHASALPEPDPEEQPSSAAGWIALAAALLATELALSIVGPGLRWRASPVLATRPGVRATRPGVRATRRRAAAASALVALLLLGFGFGPFGRLARGDALLEQGDARRALSLYRAYERRSGSSAETRVRIGNAHYRLEEPERAATQFQSALRDLGPDDRDARFVASFNLGVSYLALERFGPARDEFWSALRERPESLAAKFNYEWASERVPPDPEVPVPQTPQEQETPGGSGGGASEAEGDAPATGRSEGAPSLEQAEAERWLETLQERPGDPLRREIAKELESRPGRRRGQSW